MREEYTVPSDIKELEFEIFLKGIENAGMDKHVLFSRELLLTRFPKMDAAARRTLSWVLPQIEQNLHILTRYGIKTQTKTIIGSK